MKNKTKRFDISGDYYHSNCFIVKLGWNRTLWDFNFVEVTLYLKETIVYDKTN